jgi:hypothetical protein
VEDLVCNDLEVRFRTSTTNASIAALMQLLDQRHIELTELQVRKASLEDVFLALTADANADARADGPS